MREVADEQQRRWIACPWHLSLRDPLALATLVLQVLQRLVLSSNIHTQIWVVAVRPQLAPHPPLNLCFADSYLLPRAGWGSCTWARHPGRQAP